MQGSLQKPPAYYLLLVNDASFPLRRSILPGIVYIRAHMYKPHTCTHTHIHIYIYKYTHIITIIGIWAQEGTSSAAPNSQPAKFAP